MNVLLVAGCGLGGIGAGAALGVVATRVRAPVKGAQAAQFDAAVPATAAALATTMPDRRAQAVDPNADPSPGPIPADDAGSAALHPWLAGAVTAVLFALAAGHFGAVPALAGYCVLFAGLVAIAVADLRVGLVPRTILYPTGALLALALVVASAEAGDWRALADGAAGGVLALVAFFLIWFAYPRGIGFGDVRLAAVIGFGLGWLGMLHVYVGFLAGFVVGAVWGLVVMARRGTGRKTRIPFAPALGAGAVVAVLGGGPVISAWLPGHG